jgi:hypothetical protein
MTTRQEYTWHPDYAAIKARFPGVKLDGGDMLPMHGRVCFHQERLLYGHRLAHADYVRAAKRFGLPLDITKMARVQCIIALVCIEAAARRYPMVGRNYDTGWRDLTRDPEVYGYALTLADRYMGD